MGNYYAESLNSQKLFQVYDTALPRIEQYFREEIDFVRRKLTGTERVLEVAAGYGRIVRELAPSCAEIVGMDISEDSVRMGREYLKGVPNASMVAMDAHKITFPPQSFDVTLCLQNALSAMRADDGVIRSILDLLAPGGTAYFSTYSANFWEHRVAWFQEQADKAMMTPSNYIRAAALRKKLQVILDGKAVAKELNAIGNNLNQLTTLAHMGRVQVANLDAVHRDLDRLYHRFFELAEQESR